MSDVTQRRLTAMVSVDVVGYSRLMGTDEVGTLHALRTHRDEFIDSTIAAHGGRIVKTMGDGLLLEFPSVVNAVKCSVEMQNGMAARNADVPDDQCITFRIGINQGDVIIEGDDIYGDGVNLAARLQEIAEPGGVALSRRVHEDVQERLDTKFINGGEQSLKNIAKPVQVWRWSPMQEQTATAETILSVDVLPLPDKPSIAVLPFDNMSGDPEQEYFSDGISEDLTTALSQFGGLFVIARNSAFTYKGKAIDVQQVGRELGVRYVLEGSVRRAGDRVRVNAQLIDATAHRHVWAERFDRQIEDVFELQDDIVASIATAVGPEVTQAEIERAKSKRPGTLDAWDLYLRALAGFHKTTRDDAEEAITLLEQAIKVEPDFASAYALLGLCHSASAMHGWVQPASQGFREARRCAEEALHLAPTSPDINHALAVVLSVSGEPERAITAARRAIDLNPNFPEAFAYLGLSLVFLGRLEEGMAECYHAMRGSPRDTRGSFFYNGLGHGHFMLGEYEKSIEIAQKGQHLDPSNYGYMVTLAASNACLGRQAEAKRHVDTLLRFIPRFTLRALRKNPMFTQPEHIDKLVEAMRLAGVPE